MALWRSGGAMSFWRIGSAMLLCAFGAAAGPAQADERPLLSLPLACEPHKTCFIQNYVDDDAGPGVKDFACGGATYDGHKGVDFRLISAEATKADVPVLASADGTVKAVRDGVADIFARNNTSNDYKGRECGNGVVVDHGGGWETQYCHMKQGSVTATVGQAIKRGEKLGSVGFSGFADFAHVHLSVRHDDKVIDPFLPDAIDGACQKDAKSNGMWRPEVAAAFRYKAGEVIATGFAGAPPDMNALEVDHTKVEPLTPSSAALIFYGRMMNLTAGDRVRVVIDGPGGNLIEQLSQPLERNKATLFPYGGKKRKAELWPAGRYEGRVEIVREGAVVAASTSAIDLKP